MSRLWVDDVRPPPDDSWFWARTNKDAQERLSQGDIIEASLDHDMGYTGPPPGPCESCGAIGEVDGWTCGVCDGDGFIGGDVLYIAGTSDDDGYELVRWMIINSKVPPKVTIHSWNPVGAKNMADALHDAGHSCVVRPYELTPHNPVADAKRRLGR